MGYLFLALLWHPIRCHHRIDNPILALLQTRRWDRVPTVAVVAAEGARPASAPARRSLGALMRWLCVFAVCTQEHQYV